ncbi:putative iron-regulated protein [Enhygromyxa salina]|uniref:Putative iron-regulated protein n=1 Tax=Enhygromyxa salina TaxID=215803 RepID=A0A0C2DGB1_9BACT|nr:putative iron-regulated protein [Enhygromyxa salina]
MLLGVGCDDQPTQTPEQAATVDPNEHAFFDREGNPSDLDSFIASLADVDFVGAGELHHHGVGSQVQLAVLQGMAAQDRPVALAMEFFEADQQAPLDAYLAGSIDEPTFREQTKRDDNYERSHRPLIEFAKRNGIPVIAANAPRPLVTAYRESGATYADYLATLSEQDRALMPRSSVPPDDEFKARFMQTMGERGPAFYPAMALWNDAMAESSADFRAEHPEHRVLLIVGVYHVAKHLGVVTQYTARRPQDSVRVLSMAPIEGPMVFDPSNRDEGDVILQVR